MLRYLPILLCVTILAYLTACNTPSSPQASTDSATTAPKFSPAEFIYPARDTTVVVGDAIRVQFRAGQDEPCDSVELRLGDNPPERVDSSVAISTLHHPLGVQPLRLITWKGGSSQVRTRLVTLLAKEAPKQYGYQVLHEFPHSTDAYTQGLLLQGGYLYESTGQRGESTLRKVNIADGKAVQSHSLAAQYFGEGLTLFRGRLYQLTWTSHTAFIYDLESFAQVGQASYSSQGWGLTSDTSNLYLSDGTERIAVLAPETFAVKRVIQAYDDLGAQTMLNELEFADGLIYANVYQTDRIVAIDPATGQIVKNIVLSGLLPTHLRTLHTDVLNGIAHNPADDSFYLTGKYWPRLYQVKFKAQ